MSKAPRRGGVFQTLSALLGVRLFDRVRRLLARSHTAHDTQAQEAMKKKILRAKNRLRH